MLLAGTAAAALALSPLDAAAAPYAYMTGLGNPWGNTTNNAAMDAAFGAGNWDLYQGFTTTPFTNGTTAFVFVDGSDFGTLQFASFLAANGTVIENFVSGGGHVFLNAAPNIGGSFGMILGVTLNYGGSTFSSTAAVTPAGIAAGLLTGGLTPTYGGIAFSHATVSGPLTDLITGDAGTILGVMSYGSGLAMFGGQTTVNFHYPQPDATQLRVNQLLYAANGAVLPDGGNGNGNGTPVPEPAALGLLGSGLLGLALLRRRREPETV